MSSATSIPCLWAVAQRSRTSCSVPSSGWTAKCPPSAPPIAYGRARIVRAGDERVVAALALVDADRVERQQVEDVEAEVGDVGDELLDGLEAAERAREQLVPGGEARLDAVDLDRDRLLERAPGPRAPARPPSRGRAPGRARRRTSRGSARRTRARRSRTRSSPWSSASLAFSSARLRKITPSDELAAEVLVEVGGDLAAQLVVPGRPAVGPRLEVELPGAGRLDRELTRPAHAAARGRRRRAARTRATAFRPAPCSWTTAFIFSWPSRKMSAETATVSPTVRLTAYRPLSRTGAGFAILIRLGRSLRFGAGISVPGVSDKSIT